MKPQSCYPEEHAGSWSVHHHCTIMETQLSFLDMVIKFHAL